MKRILAGFAVLAILGLLFLGCGSGSAQAGKFKPGTYAAYADGRGGPILVEIECSANRIESVKVLSHHETHNIGNIPLERYPDLIVKNQSLNIDMVTGATLSSAGMLRAVRNAVVLAGGNPSTLNAEVPREAEPAQDASADVVVIGSGAAGLTAAVNARMAGKNVILVEKLSILGGTSNYSIESFGSSETITHRALQVAATAQTNYQAYVAANPRGKPTAFRILADNNGKAADWLRSIGALMPVAGSGTSVAPSREVGKMGVTIISALINEARKAGVDIRTDTKAVELLSDGARVTGLRVQNPNGAYTINAKSVVIATGGFGANNEMVAQVQPHLQGYGFACSPGATGDGHLMAQALGAELTDMDYVRVNFTYHNSKGIVYYTGSIANTGAVFVTNDGIRVINEGGGYGVGPTVAEQYGGQGWMIFDSSIADGVQDVREYRDLGIFESAPTLEELADKIGVNRANLVGTIRTYQGYVANGRDPDFSRALLTMTFDEPPFYACKFTCHVQGTFGGIATDLNTRVLKADGSAIQNLYAAGECAVVGVWGANPMATNLVFGKIAGDQAAANAQ